VCGEKDLKVEKVVSQMLDGVKIVVNIITSNVGIR
jgi:hypothetical protein